MVDIEPSIDEKNDAFAECEYESMEIVQIKFVDANQLAVLAKFRYKTMRTLSCLLTIDLKETELDFQANLRFDDYEMGLNELTFNFGIIPNEISINDTKKYLFSADVDAQTLSVCGKRKLAAVSCDPSADNECNRLIVLDINCDGQESEDEDEEIETESDDPNNDKQEMSTSDDDNEDSDLKNIVDID